VPTRNDTVDVVRQRGRRCGREARVDSASPVALIGARPIRNDTVDVVRQR
jgi:hypothetical protein